MGMASAMHSWRPRPRAGSALSTQANCRPRRRACSDLTSVDWSGAAAETAVKYVARAVCCRCTRRPRWRPVGNLQKSLDDSDFAELKEKAWLSHAAEKTKNVNCELRESGEASLREPGLDAARGERYRSDL